MDSFETVIFEVRDSVAWITLNRPRVLNAYNIQMRDDLFEALTAVSWDPEVRAVVISGAGDRAFCAGADLTEFGTAPSQRIARQVRWERDVWGILMDLPIPTIAAMHGYIFGSGLEIALCCDIRIATTNAIFGLPETSLGFIPAAGATQTFPRAVGAGQALWTLLTAERMDANRAFSIGLISEIVPDGGLSDRCEALVEGFLESGAEALAAAKSAMRRGLDLPLREGLGVESGLARGLVRVGDR